MSRFLIWGTGGMATQFYRFYSQISLLQENEIICFIDNDCENKKMFKGIPVISPLDINQYEYDYISIWTPKYEKEIKRQITEELNIPNEKIADIFFPYKELLCAKYNNSDDIEVQEVLEKICEMNGLGVYYFERKNETDKLNEAFYDASADLYYIFFEGKRMYLKRTYDFWIDKESKRFVGDMWGEQSKNSPHLYEENSIKIEQNDILVDAGVCEGNFSLHHIDKVKKLYLIECDEEWMEALHYTFLPYKDKVVFSNRFLSNKDSDKTICLDTLVTGKVNFIKMDIEGEEINALKGANRVLEENKSLKCAICSYHRHGDEQAIRSILQKYGFETETSKGYMLFLGDNYVLNNPELRKGVVRGIKY